MNADWPIIKHRFEAFWNQEIVDRCMIAAFAPGDTPLPPENPEDKWIDPNCVIAATRHELATAYYAGDAVPMLNHNLGASGHAGFFRGAKYQLAPDTVWFFKSLDDPDTLVFDENSLLFQKTVQLPKRYAEDSRGDYIISMPDCTGNADALSHLMGAEELLAAMLTEPEAVQRALHKIEESYERAMTEVFAAISENNDGGGAIGWLRTWAPGFHAQMQSDMSVMISSDMFNTFIMPELEAQCAFLDYPLYHFDGIEQLRHLDSLLSIPKLRAIQWTQVAGQPPATAYIEALQKIQHAGKSLVIIAHPEQVPALLRDLSPEGLFLLVNAQNPAQADEVVAYAKKRA